MTTSANVTEFTIFKDGEKVGTHRQHALCKSHWEELLKYEPISKHTIQAWGYDEEEEYWEDRPIRLNLFLSGNCHLIGSLDRMAALWNAANGLSTEEAVERIVKHDVRMAVAGKLMMQKTRMLTVLKAAHAQNKVNEECIGGCDYNADCSCPLSEMIEGHAAFIKEMEDDE